MNKTIVLEGKEHSRKEYLDALTKLYAKKYKGVEIKKTTLNFLLEMAEKGDELADDNPKEFFEILEDIQGHLKAEKPAAKVETAEDKENEPQKPIRAKKSHPNKASEVFEITMKDDGIQDIDAKFKFHAFGVDIDPSATEGEIGNKLRRTLEANEFTRWAIGDLANALQDRGYEDVLVNMCAYTGLSESTLYGHMAASRYVPKENRHIKLLPSTVRRIVTSRFSKDEKKNKEIKDGLLEKVISEGLSSTDIDSEIENSRDCEKQDKGRVGSGTFLVVPIEGTPYLLREEPAFIEGAKIFDIKKKKHLATFKKDDHEVIQWEEIQTKDA